MDYDLFELDSDEFLCSLAATDIEKIEQLETNPYPMLNCIIKDVSTSKYFSQESFIKNLFIFKEDYKNINVKEDDQQLTEYKFSPDLLLSIDEISQYILRNARMHIQILAGNLRGNLDCDDENSFFQQRKQVTLLYHILLMQNSILIPLNIYQNLQNIRKLLNSFVNKEIISLICVPDCSSGNESKSAAYHFLHGFLEWRFLDLILNKQRQQNLIELNQIGDENKEVLQLYETFMNDLLMLSFCYFKKNKIKDIINLCCFPCVCIKEMWLLLQLLSEKYDKELNFWKLFNTLIEKNREITDTSKQELIIFEIWLIKEILILEGYKKDGTYEGLKCSRITNNFEIIAKTTELFSKTEPSEENLRIFLIILMPIILEWLNPKANVPMILWEYFYKKINSSFYIAGSSPSSLAISSSSGRGYLERIKSLLSENSSQLSSLNDLNDSSFSLFLIILGKIIEKLIQISQINQINKILARILVKFSPSKLQTLNEIGIHNLIELFLTLIKSSQLKDMAFKLKDKLLSISLDTISINCRICITKGHIALITYFYEIDFDISDYIIKLLEQLTNINNDLTISKIIIDGMCDILKISKNFNKGEHLFIDAWFSNFLNSCTSVEMERILEAFHIILEKLKLIIMENGSLICNNDCVFTEKPIEFFNALTIHVLPFVRQSLTSTSSTWIPVLAADFCILTLSFNGLEQFQNLFKSLLEATSFNIRTMLKFLLAVLDCNYYISSIDSTIIIQMWLKSLVLLSANDEDVINLSKKVANLPEFHDISNLKDDDLLSSKEPLLKFVSAVGNNYESCEDFKRKCEITDKFNSYLISFDKWILDKNEKSEVSYRFYSFIAIVIFNCAGMVYVRSKVACFFHIAMTRFILPSSVQIGKVPDTKLCQIVHKVFAVVIQGIGKLNFNSDPYVVKTLTDLIVKWTPHFKSLKNGKTFANCINEENELLSIFIFQKLSTTFLSSQRRQPQMNALLIITIFKDVVTEISNNENKMKIFVKSTIFIIFEHLMMVDGTFSTQKILLDLFEKITKSIQTLNSEIIRSILIEKIKLIVTKHLAHCSMFCFQLLNQITNIYTEIIEEILPFIEDQIKIVEEKRGSYCDNRLRNSFEKLKGTILATNMKNNK